MRRARPELTDGELRALRYLQTHRPLDVDDLPHGYARDVDALERGGLVSRHRNMALTARRMATRPWAVPAVAVQFDLMPAGFRALADNRGRNL